MSDIEKGLFLSSLSEYGEGWGEVTKIEVKFLIYNFE